MAFVETAILECPDCVAAVAATLEHAYAARFGEHGEEDVRFSMLKCPRCGGAFLCSQEGYPDQDALGDGYTAWTSHSMLYPKPVTTPDPSVPKPIAESYVEAHRCFRASASTATAIMCRRTLEGLCAHYGQTAGSLQSKLEGLQKAGVIERRLFEWADALRLAGNDAAHDVDEIISKEDAKDLLDFTRAILEYVFTFAAAFTKFQNRRAHRKQGP